VVEEVPVEVLHCDDPQLERGVAELLKQLPALRMTKRRGKP